MSRSFEIREIVASDAGERLDKYLAAQFADLSRAQIQALIRAGRVTVNGAAARASLRLEGGERIRVQVPVVDRSARPEPEAIPLVVLYEDEHVAWLTSRRAWSSIRRSGTCLARWSTPC